MQLPPQYSRPLGHVHAPAEQLDPPEQITPHWPQFVALLSRSSHKALQRVCPAGHTHSPASQELPPAQTLPHAPQSSSSELTSTHFPPAQRVSPAAHAGAQAPALQTADAAQAFAHVPQLCAEPRSAQVEPQSVRPTPHAQDPPRQ